LGRSTIAQVAINKRTKFEATTYRIDGAIEDEQGVKQKLHGGP